MQEALTVCRASPLKLQLAPANSKFPSSSGSALFLQCPRGVGGQEWNYRLQVPSSWGLLALREYLSWVLPEFQDALLLQINFMSHLCVSFLAQNFFFFFCF